MWKYTSSANQGIVCGWNWDNTHQFPFKKKKEGNFNFKTKIKVSQRFWNISDADFQLIVF